MNIKLYHYSNADIKGFINPIFFGNNSFSENSVNVSEIKRSYFYIAPDIREYYFNSCKYCYIAEIEHSRLYDIRTDKLHLLANNKDIYAEAKRRGYIGLIGNNGYDVIALFKKIKIKKQITLTKF